MPLLDLIADQRCVGCERVGRLLCPACRHSLPWLGGDVCGRCGEPGPARPLRCARCRALGRRIAFARSALRHDAAGAHLVRAWKDAGRAAVAGLAAQCLVAAGPRPSGLLVPVPVVPARAAWRGVDGPAALARILADRWGLPRADLLERRTSTPQRGLGATARRRNAAAGFAVVGQPPETVILVDDVLTTGATLRACAARLHEAGARRIGAVTFTRVVRG
jgi:predicted amidophosphoribosyltransferase